MTKEKEKKRVRVDLSIDTYNELLRIKKELSFTTFAGTIRHVLNTYVLAYNEGVRWGYYSKSEDLFKPFFVNQVIDDINFDDTMDFAQLYGLPDEVLSTEEEFKNELSGGHSIYPISALRTANKKR